VKRQPLIGKSLNEATPMNPFKLLWSFDGRIGRIAYAGGWLLNLVLMFAAMAVVLYLRESWTPPVPFNVKDGSLLAVFPVAVLFYWAQLALAAKRLHDLGVTGWFSLLLLVPGAGLIVVIVLLVARGDDNDNRYGPRVASTSTLAPAQGA
jgi:uncharacterized membrane protein YhaH (DUF805 family)